MPSTACRSMNAGRKPSMRCGTTTTAAVPTTRELLSDKLEGAKYPVRNINVVDRPDGTAEIVATLISTAVHPEELDTVIAALDGQPGLQHAAWSVRTSP